MSKTPERPHVSKPSRKRVFSHGGSSLRAALYARVSTHDQQTLPIQLSAMRQYVRKRGWATAFEVKEVGSGGALRQKRAELLAATRRREVDVIIVWRLAMGALSGGSRDHANGAVIGEGRVRISHGGARSDHAERPRARRDARCLCRIRAGYSARPGESRGCAGPEGRQTSRQATNRHKTRSRNQKLFKKGVSKCQIATRLKISRTSVRRLLDTP